jgi:hypothetical protein
LPAVELRPKAALGLYSLLLVGLLGPIIFISGNRGERPIFLMADGLILLRNALGGALARARRRRLALGPSNCI